MKFQNPYFFCALLCFLLTNCTTQENPTEPTLVAIEVWGFIMDNDSANHGEATFKKLSDGTITTNAIWHFLSGNDMVSCPIEEGNVLIKGDSLKVTAQGTATNSNPQIPPGFNTSPFTINVKGTTHNGTASGQWQIFFTTFGWPPTIQGTFTAVRKSGSGITN